ncbi:MAG: hypothetical protein ACKVGZ_19515, partial [Alphaproteobacteria bacterium]
VVMRARLLRARGKLQREGLVIHLVADHVEDCSHLLMDLDGPLSTLPWQQEMAPADEVVRPQGDHRRFPVKSRDFH